VTRLYVYSGWTFTQIGKGWQFFTLHENGFDSRHLHSPLPWFVLISRAALVWDVYAEVHLHLSHTNFHVELREDRHYCSVPHHLRRSDPLTRVNIVYEDRVVTIY
jgi:hypothetical protein